MNACGPEPEEIEKAVREAIELPPAMHAAYGQMLLGLTRASVVLLVAGAGEGSEALKQIIKDMLPFARILHAAIHEAARRAVRYDQVSKN